MSGRDGELAMTEASAGPVRAPATKRPAAARGGDDLASIGRMARCCPPRSAANDPFAGARASYGSPGRPKSPNGKAPPVVIYSEDYQ